MNKNFSGILANNLLKKHISGKGIAGKGFIENNISKLLYLDGEIGNVDTSIVVIIFSKPVIATGNNYLNGVTIKVDGAQVTITGAAKQADERIIYYQLLSSVNTGQNITWEYDSTTGGITDLNNDKLDNVTPQNIANNVFSITYLLDFGSVNNSFYASFL